MGKSINVIKATGVIEPFSEEKVISSLKRAGAPEILAKQIVTQIIPHLYQNIPSFEIYNLVMETLKKEQKLLAERYNLKQAIMELGPTGYPFEKFMAAVLKEGGFENVITNKTVLGKCVSHEIDIVAERKKKTFMIECKFHNQPGARTDIKVALYTYARFLDVQKRGFDNAWLITNTKVTQDVKAYCLCMGMEVTSWDYPDSQSLRKMIDKSMLHPVTAIASLSVEEKQSLLDRGIVFCRDYESCSKIV